VLFSKRIIAREKKTINVMIGIFCGQKHSSKKGALCPGCHELREYAYLRLDKCPFGEKKTACADCAVHCYQPQRRQEIVAVMRYSGPKMILKHPVLAMYHVLKKS
jgi:predicted amidophosphoribosyltransferase